MDTTTPNSSFDIAAILRDPKVIRLRNWRMMKDQIVRHAMTVGGIGVIVAILLIFLYLLIVVAPLFSPPSMKEVKQFALPSAQAGKTLFLAMEEKNEIGVRFTEQGKAIFFKLASGEILKEFENTLPENTQIVSLASSDSSSQVVALGLSNGSAIVMRHAYGLNFADNAAGTAVRTIVPEIKYPLGKEPVVVDTKGEALSLFAVQLSDSNNTFVALTASKRLVLTSVSKTVNFLTEEETLESSGGELPWEYATVTQLLLSKDQRALYVADAEGYVTFIDINDKSKPKVVNRVQVVKNPVQLTAIKFLTGDISLLIGDSTGRVAQWFPVRNEKGEFVLTYIRDFKTTDKAINDIASEERRKGFATADDTGRVGIYHATSHNQLLSQQVSSSGIAQITLSPRADRLLVQDKTATMHVWEIHNEHPEVSFYSLWGKVWYESYPEPAYIWQSSAATADFEPKFSLVPLAFGTFKAAFYAMLIAIPLALFGAVYAAYFMSAGLRTYVKPTIEIMEALPTVILGFLAGLWLAPVIEANLPGTFLMFLLLPLVILLCAFSWHRFVPKEVKYRIPDGWEAALLILPILFTIALSFLLSHSIEALLFQGDMRHWLTTHGIPFDQRNALIVGIAMGLAVIPNIFSIAEDAIFSVPKHLTAGSLALGATKWQTMIRVVLLTASPGIFSAIMIGLGRAVGETMIVLMATGNTAVLDFSAFQGLRTLSANIAVEMPESEVGSTHFRILFLSALVLFLLTFLFNTIAESVRHSLRKKYSSL